MKKIISLAILLAMIFLTACSNVSSPLDNGTTNATTDQIINSAESQITNSMETQNENQTTGVSDFLACKVWYKFSSLEDFETYLITGSKDVSDYSYVPFPGFDYLPSPDEIYAKGYLPICETLGIDADSFECVNMGFSHSNGGFAYGYYFDGISISVEPAQTNNIAEEMVHINANIDVENLTAPKSYGYVLKEENGLNIVYRMKDGKKWIAYFMIEDYCIKINISRNPDTFLTDVQAFMTSPKTAALAPLFSDDAEVFGTYVEQLKTRVEKQ